MDSDGALDLLGEVNDVVNAKLKDMFKAVEGVGEPSELYAHVGVVEKLLKDGFFVPAAIVSRCVGILDTCLGDKEWMGSWRGPEKARQGITAFRDALQALVDDVPDDDTVLAPRGWMCRDFEFEPGTSRTGLFELNMDKDGEGDGG